ncbi:MAG: hypothetical protein AAFY91_13040 [Bacteroidota bacterium]
MIRTLHIILIVFACIHLHAQKAPWEFIADSTPDTLAPLVLVEGRTNLELTADFFLSDPVVSVPTIYDTSTHVFNADAGDVIEGRFGFTYRLPETSDYVEFDIFLDVGTGIDPVQIGHYAESRQDTWRSVNPEFSFFAGDSVAARGAIIYAQVYQGSLELAYFDLLSKVCHDADLSSGTDPPPLTTLPDVNTTDLQPGDVLQWSGTEFVNVSAFIYTVVWAEENGGISGGTLGEYSFGNGATGTANFGLPIWQDCEIVGMVVNAESAATDATFVCTINGLNISEQVTATTNNTVEYFPSAVSVSQGDLLNFRTVSTTGTWNDVRIGAILKLPINYE